jgi:hypothetical protein
MNDNLADQATSVIKRAVDLLFVKNPKGTSMGVLLGLLAETIIKILGSTEFSKVGTLYYILLGVFVFNLPSALRRHRLDPQIEAALHSINKARRNGSISRQQEREMYIRLYERVLEQIDLKEPGHKKSQQTRVIRQEKS